MNMTLLANHPIRHPLYSIHLACFRTKKSPIWGTGSVFLNFSCGSDQILAGCPDSSLGPVVYSNLVENMDHMAFYGMWADFEMGRDFSGIHLIISINKLNGHTYYSSHLFSRLSYINLYKHRVNPYHQMKEICRESFHRMPGTKSSPKNTFPVSHLVFDSNAFEAVLNQMSWLVEESVPCLL